MKPAMHGLFVGLWMSLLVKTAVKRAFANAPMRRDTGNPAVYLAAALVLGLAATATMLAPARRGASADPPGTLHYE